MALNNIKSCLFTKEFILVSTISFALIFAIDLTTNNLDTRHLIWDHQFYIDMLQNGIIDNKNLYPPFAYRYGSILPAKLFTIFGFTLFQSFKITSYIGATLQLTSIYFISLYISKKRIAAHFLTLCIAFSFFHIKFLQNDVYRPDHLAYFIVCINFYLLINNSHFYLLLLLSCIGVFIREFTVVPITVYYLFKTLNIFTLKKQEIIKLLLSGLLLSMCVLLPRLLINVNDNTALINPTYDLRNKLNYYKLLLIIGRDKNIIFAYLIYFLPTIMLLTPKRFLLILNLSKDLKIKCIIYFILVSYLIIYGGTDVGRFVTYLFPIQILIISYFFRENKVFLYEIILILLAMFLTNGIIDQIPNSSPDRYLYFIGFYKDFVGEKTIQRLTYAVVFVVLINIVRAFYINKSV